MRPPFEFDCSANQLRLANQEIESAQRTLMTPGFPAPLPVCVCLLCKGWHVVTFILSEKLSGRSAPAAALAPSYIIHHEKKKVLPPARGAAVGVAKKKDSCKFARSCVTAFNTPLHPSHKIFVVYPGFHSNLRPPRSPIQFLYHLLEF